eukprot:2218120-Pyramimonas_sp.AAC.1
MPPCLRPLETADVRAAGAMIGIGGSGAQPKRKRTPPACASASLLPPPMQHVPCGKGMRAVFQATWGRM